MSLYFMENNDTSDICLYDYHHMRKKQLISVGLNVEPLCHGWLEVCVLAIPPPKRYTIYHSTEQRTLNPRYASDRYILGKQSTGNHGFLASHIEVSGQGRTCFKFAHELGARSEFLRFERLAMGSPWFPKKEHTLGSSWYFMHHHYNDIQW